jgi:predicted component of type VI protein secretion system
VVGHRWVGWGVRFWIMAGMVRDAGAVSVVLAVGVGGIVRAMPQPIAGPCGGVPGLTARRLAQPAAAAIARLLELRTQPRGAGPRRVIGQVSNRPRAIEMHFP